MPRSSQAVGSTVVWTEVADEVGLRREQDILGPDLQDTSSLTRGLGHPSKPLWEREVEYFEMDELCTVFHLIYFPTLTSKTIESEECHGPTDFSR